MSKGLWLCVLFAAAISTPASAQCTSFPDTLTNGTTADATQVMADFNYLGNCTAPLANPSFTGNVGIGTTSPGTALDLNGALSARGMAAPAVSPAGQGRIYFDSTSNTFEVSQNGAAYTALVGGGGSSQWSNGSGGVIYYDGGNVGIGTATPAALLNVADNSTTGGELMITSGNGPYATAGLIFRTPLSGTNEDGRIYSSFWGNTVNSALVQGMTFQSPRDLSGWGFNFASNGGISRMFIDTSSGSVGIGTTTPASTLDVNGSIQMDGGNVALLASNGNLYVRTGGNSPIVFQPYSSSSPPTAQFTNGGMSLGESYSSTSPPSNGAIIQGDVGIGTTSPGQLLEVDGTAKIDTGLIVPLIYPASNSTTAIQIDEANGTTNVMDIDTTNGRVGIGTTSPADSLEVNGKVKIDSFASASSTTVCQNAGVFSSCSSSIRYKEDVKDARFGLGEVAKMRPVTFKWKGREERDLGLIAEEVAKIDPLFVTYKDGKIEGVKYAQLTAVLVNAVKELKGANDRSAVKLGQQARMLAALQSQNATLKEQLAGIERRLDGGKPRRIEASADISAASQQTGQ